MCGKIEVEVSFSIYTANHLTVCSQIICSVPGKWHFNFYLSVHSNFGPFYCVAYLYPKDYIKVVKNPFPNPGWVHYAPFSPITSVKKVGSLGTKLQDKQNIGKLECHKNRQVTTYSFRF